LSNANRGDRETRKEARYPTNDQASVSVAPQHSQKRPCKILNVSRSGLQLELAEALTVHIVVEVAIIGGVSGGVIIFGEVRYCRQVGDVFHAGVEIQDAVFGKALTTDHIDEDRLSLYASGVGLTSGEVLRIKMHLERCPQCIAALAEVSQINRRLHAKTPNEP